MRTTTSAEDTALAAHAKRHDFRVYVENASGTLKEVTDLEGVNWLDAWEISASVDQPIPTATGRFHKYDPRGNLAPLDETSPLNVDDADAYAALMDSGRTLVIESATVAAGESISASDYHEVFRGTIDEPEWAGEQVIVRARDENLALLNDRMIEDRTTYGSAGGTAVETVMQNIINDWADGSVTLWTPTSPGFLVTEGEWEHVRVLDALMSFAGKIGWTLRSVWRDSANEFQVQFAEPDRTASTTVWDFNTRDIFEVSDLRIDGLNVRNVIEVEYTDANGDRQTVTVSDTDSINRFDRQWMRVSEASDSPIDTASEATDLANAILSDLKDPQATQKTVQDYFWPIELGDYLGFSADDRWYSTDQQLAVYGYRHRLSREEHVTDLMVRGQPAGQYLNWEPWEAPAGVPDQNPSWSLDPSQSGSTGTLSVEVEDPARQVTAIEFQTKTGAGDYGGTWLSGTDWDSSSGVAGTASVLTRSESVTLSSKHNTSIKVRLSWTDADGRARSSVREVTFDSDHVAEVDGIEIDFDANGQAVVSISADEDTVAAYVTVGNGTTPSDPTAASNDGDITGRSGTADTGVAITTGNEAVVKVVGENSNGELGPVKTAKQSRRLGAFYKNPTSATVTGTTAETTIQSFTVPAGTMGLNGVLRMDGLFRQTSGSGGYTVRFYFGGDSVGSVFVGSSDFGQGVEFRFVMFNQGAANTQRWKRREWITDTTGSGGGSATVDTTVDQDIEITVQLDVSTDEITTFMLVAEYAGTD